MAMEMLVLNAERISALNFAPPTAVSVRLVLTVEPADGAVLVYTPARPEPIRFDGPQSVHDVPLTGEFIYVQMISGASKWTAVGVGYE